MKARDDADALDKIVALVSAGGRRVDGGFVLYPWISNCRDEEGRQVRLTREFWERVRVIPGYAWHCGISWNTEPAAAF